MRTREIYLFLLFVVLALFNHERLGATLVETAAMAEAMSMPGFVDQTRWQYDESSEYYLVVPERVRRMTSAQPIEVADAVCSSLGGSVDVIQPDAMSRQRVGFNCAFHEPGLSMSADFGELRRSSENSH